MAIKKYSHNDAIQLTEHFNSSELVSKMKGDSDRKTKIDQVIGLFDKSY